MDEWDELDCTVCGELLFEPVSLFCGHAFCRPCLVRAMDYSTCCPLCRTVVHIDPITAPQCVIIQSLVEKGGSLFIQPPAPTSPYISPP